MQRWSSADLAAHIVVEVEHGSAGLESLGSQGFPDGGRLDFGCLLNYKDTQDTCWFLFSITEMFRMHKYLVSYHY